MRCELFNYVEAVLRAPRQKSMNFITNIGCIFAGAVSVYFGLAALNPGAFALSFLAGLVYVMSVTANTAYIDNAPNIASMMPLSPRKSLLFRFLAVLIIYVMTVIIMAAVILIVSGITGGIVFLIGLISGGVESGGETDAGEVVEEVEIIKQMGVNGGIFAAAYFVFMYGMGMLVGLIKNLKARYIAAGCLCAAILGGMVLMSNPFIQESYDKMAVPWLCTALCCVAAVAAFGTAIYMGIKRYKTSY